MGPISPLRRLAAAHPLDGARVPWLRASSDLLDNSSSPTRSTQNRFLTRDRKFVTNVGDWLARSGVRPAEPPRN